MKEEAEEKEEQEEEAKKRAKRRKQAGIPEIDMDALPSTTCGKNMTPERN